MYLSPTKHKCSIQILTNHTGYEKNGPKRAILVTPDGKVQDNIVYLVSLIDNKPIAELPLGKATKIAKWPQGYFHHIDFSHIKRQGRYIISAGRACSQPFTIQANLLFEQTHSDVLHYFKSQRCSGVFDRHDHRAQVLESEQYIDVHGGWYDASGDMSKYLSHLSYSNYFNPQQTPIVVWNLIRSLKLLEPTSVLTFQSKRRFVDEALHGADFLLRMQSKQGYFYLTVFDQWSKKTSQREICAFSHQSGQKSAEFHAGFRQGGGIAIASLAAASRLEDRGDFDSTDYLKGAEQGYWHLKEYNHLYIDDGQENIIDHYCALIASVELYKSTHNDRYLTEARLWCRQLMEKQQCDDNFAHFWSVDNTTTRPFYHPVEAGLPAIALCEYIEVESDKPLSEQARCILENAVKFEVNITTKVANVFGYPRQYIKPINGIKKDAFFMAQSNETLYWWQGENARLSSLSTMAFFSHSHIQSPDLKEQLLDYAQNSLNWVLGLNPYNVCMLDGHGVNNCDYLPQQGFYNAKGGICNGITAGIADDETIAFNPAEYQDDMTQNWRWSEQWLPHAAWYLLAISAQVAHYFPTNLVSE